MKKIILSQEDYEFFVDYCNKEPDPETLTKLKKLLDNPSPWDIALTDGLDEWEWPSDPWEDGTLGCDEEFVKKVDEETEAKVDKALDIDRGDKDE